MVRVRITIHLPYLLVLPAGEYPTPAEGGSVHLSEIAVETQAARTIAFGLFPTSADPEADDTTKLRVSESTRLLRRVNHLLRWYRVTTGEAEVLELTRAQVSPFRFTIDDTDEPWGTKALLEYEASAPQRPPSESLATFGAALRAGLAGRSDPEVAQLNLLDADHALNTGRFREAVLLSWGAIDSTFVRKFKQMVDAQLATEWSEAREFLKGLDFGLRHKMTTGLRLLGGRSLFHEPNDFWRQLSASYDCRNKIIHEGHVAHEDDAKLAISVARRVVQIVADLSAKHTV